MLVCFHASSSLVRIGGGWWPWHGWLVKDGDLDTFLAHENQATPPSLSQNWSLKVPKKKIRNLCCLSQNDSLCEVPEIDANVIDRAVIINPLLHNVLRCVWPFYDISKWKVNMLKPTYGKTFSDYTINTLDKWSLWTSMR